MQSNAAFNEAAQKTINRFSKRMLIERKLEYWGVGYGPDHFAIQFSMFRPMEVAEARQLVMDTTATFVKAINNSPELAPYLAHRPITRDDVEVGIYSHKKKTRSLSPEWPIAPHVEVVAMSGDEIIYAFEDQGLEEHRITETFETAQARQKSDEADEIAQFAEHVSTLNFEHSIENLIKKANQKK